MDGKKEGVGGNDFESMNAVKDKGKMNKRVNRGKLKEIRVKREKSRRGSGSSNEGAR